MRGKDKCKLLRAIRQRIAEENDIPCFTRECGYEGDDCGGTCPLCESELHELERQLQLRWAAGKPVRLSALCEGMLPEDEVTVPEDPEASFPPDEGDILGSFGMRDWAPPELPGRPASFEPYDRPVFDTYESSDGPDLFFRPGPQDDL